LHAVLTMAGAAQEMARFPNRWRGYWVDSVGGGFGCSAMARVDASDALGERRANMSAAWGEYFALLCPAAAVPAWRAEDKPPLGLTPMTQWMFEAWINVAA
jgi:aspartyl-tRNA(Asn)/glutamyl-tRNA(Gln) amidotransferase subunit A